MLTEVFSRIPTLLRSLGRVTCIHRWDVSMGVRFRAAFGLTGRRGPVVEADTSFGGQGGEEMERGVRDMEWERSVA